MKVQWIALFVTAAKCVTTTLAFGPKQPQTGTYKNDASRNVGIDKNKIAPQQRHYYASSSLSLSEKNKLPDWAMNLAAQELLNQPQQAENPPTNSKQDDDKFGFIQRLESIKCVVLGALSGGLALAPVSLLKDLLLTGQSLAQWEFDSDAGSLEGALFAIVYRYSIRQDDNPQLNQGVIGAFSLTHALAKIQVPPYCSALPVDCGAPFGYFDFAMLWQLVLNGIESAVLFVAVAAAMDYSMGKGYISKFPG